MDECKTNNGGCHGKRTCKNTEGSRTCEDCPSGWTNKGDTECTCDVTRYIDNDDCKECPTGHECNGETKTKCHDTDQYVKENKCVACLAGATCDGDKATCGNNKYIENDQCKACPGTGHVCDGETKTKCHVTDQYVKENECVDCPDGYTCDGDEATCDVTKYIDNYKCKACPDGHMCDGKDKTKCDVPDQYVKDNECVKCPDGRTCNGHNATRKSIDLLGHTIHTLFARVCIHALACESIAHQFVVPRR